MDSAPAGRLKQVLARLAHSQPQCLLVEGGSEAGRLELALWWAMTVNCQQARAGSAAMPCGECAICRQIAANEYNDLFLYDGRITNKADEDNPGPVRALRMENVRELKSLAATAPHGDGKRVAIFQGLGQTREEAMNSLLKTLEEPSPHTLFVLLTPLRQQILPTLVSRSFCLTLPWPESSNHDERWERDLADFLGGNAKLLDKLAARGALDAQGAGAALLACQKSMVRIMSGKGAGVLDQALLPLTRNIKKSALASRWLAEGLEMLSATVSPLRVLEAFCSRLYILLRQQ